MARDTLFAYPDFNEEFKIITNARKLQSGAVIKKNDKSIAFYGRKINDSHKRYTVT